MKPKILTLIIVLFVIVVGSAVGILFNFPYDPLKPPKADDTGSTPEGIQEVVNANNQFAFDLYSELIKSKHGNIFYSPYSISAAFAMVYEGARGKTSEEIQSVFHFPEYSELRPNFAAIYNEINSNHKDYELRTGNALWLQKDFHLLKNYKDIIKRYYGGKAAEVDFSRAPDASIKTINTFIEEQTNHKIKNLLSRGDIDSSTLLVITNAVYFNGEWMYKFDPGRTEDMYFRIDPKNLVKVPMMSMKPKEKLNYFEDKFLQILKLPYKGNRLSMLIILPKDNLTMLESKLSAEMISHYREMMKETYLDEILIPKFEFDTKYYLSHIFFKLEIFYQFI
ncbi:MAG: serpin [Candidatus Woesearchaeota archaeon]|nr:serpin [Candidatus Woesearchaeota archaeon]